MSPLQNPLRRALIGAVRTTFHDASRGEAPIERSLHALHPPGSVIWRVHGDVTTMMIGGVASLFLQMLHPQVLAGVWDHSKFREDTLGRLRRTARFIAVTTYGERSCRRSRNCARPDASTSTIAGDACPTARRIARPIPPRLPGSMRPKRCQLSGGLACAMATRA